MELEALNRELNKIRKYMSSEHATKSTMGRRNAAEAEYRRLCVLGSRLGYWPAQKLRSKHRGN